MKVQWQVNVPQFAGMSKNVARFCDIQFIVASVSDRAGKIVDNGCGRREFLNRIKILLRDQAGRVPFRNKSLRLLPEFSTLRRISSKICQCSYELVVIEGIRQADYGILGNFIHGAVALIMVCRKLNSLGSGPFNFLAVRLVG